MSPPSARVEKTILQLAWPLIMLLADRAFVAASWRQVYSERWPYYAGLLATLTAWCEHHQIPYQGVPVGMIKRHATGKGNASKIDVIAAMRALGHTVTDDNEADALAILHWAIDTQEV